MRVQENLEIKERMPLLDKNGHLNKIGWARDLVFDYDRKAIKGGALRIKEWDYYFVTGPGYALAITISDNSYMALDSISLLIIDPKATKEKLGNAVPSDKLYLIDHSWEHTQSPMRLLTLGKTNFPKSSEIGDVEAKGKGYFIRYENPGPNEEGITKRRLTFKMENFFEGKPIEGDIILTQNSGDSIVMTTPFKEKATAFFYNQKINCLEPEGKVSFDGIDFIFEKEDSFGSLDWGRGVWTYKNTWYWGSASGKVKDHLVGFNLGYGFGNNPATENMFFIDGIGHKLSNVTFNIPMRPKCFTTRGSCCGTSSGMQVETAEKVEDYMSPWTFTSDDGRFEMDFVPIMNRKALVNLGLLGSNQNQVFGYYTGKVILDDDSVINIENMLGFAEKVYNKW